MLRNLPGRLIDDHSGHKVGADCRTLAGLRRLLLLVEQVKPAERRPNHQGHPVPIDRVGIQAGVVTGRSTRRQGQMEEPGRQTGQGRVLSVRARPETLDHARDVLEVAVRAETRSASGRYGPRSDPSRWNPYHGPGRSPPHARPRRLAPPSTPPCSLHRPLPRFESPAGPGRYRPSTCNASVFFAVFSDWAGCRAELVSNHESKSQIPQRVQASGERELPVWVVAKITRTASTIHGCSKPADSPPCAPGTPSKPADERVILSDQLGPVFAPSPQTFIPSA